MKVKILDRGNSPFAVVRIDRKRGIKEIERGGLISLRDGDGQPLPNQRLVMWESVKDAKSY